AGGSWAQGPPPSVRAPWLKQQREPLPANHLTEEQLAAYTHMDAETFAVLEPTLGQSARDRIRRLRSIASADPAIVSKESQKELEQLTQHISKQQSKHDKAVHALQRAAEYFSECEDDLETLKAKHKGVADRAAKAIAAVGGSLQASAPVAGGEGPAAQLLARAQELGAPELAARLEAVLAE
ncbi:unnamed protein product, partial [Prorocentrum cordatum]